MQERLNNITTINNEYETKVGDVEIKLDSLSEPQKQFMLSRARYTAYGGARGGGKSYALRTKAKLLALFYPGIQILIIRRTLPELIENHFKFFQKELKGVADIRQAPWFEINFPNGSRIRLGYCAKENDVLQYQGQSFEVILVDEATHLTEFQVNCLTECNRLSGNVDTSLGLIPRMYFTANPGGVGHIWFKRLFIDKIYQGAEDPNDYVMIQARVYDNKFIMDNDPGYVKALENLPETRRKQMLEGDWDVFEGQFFGSFDRDFHTCDPFPIPKDWRIYRARDYGLDMLACYWFAVDHEGFAYAFKGVRGSDLIVSEAGKLINEATTEKIYCDLFPPDLYNKNSQTGKSATDIFYQECGHYPTQANNDRINGWLAVHEWFAPRKDMQGNVRPGLVIFRSLTDLIRTITQIQFSDKKPGDAATQPHELTHDTDALRYFCASWTIPPVQHVAHFEKPFNISDFALKIGDYAEKEKIEIEGVYKEWD